MRIDNHLEQVVQPSSPSLSPRGDWRMDHTLSPFFRHAAVHGPDVPYLGSTRDLVDNTGAVRNHIVYSSFGQVLSQTDPALSTRYLFAGRELDAETGLYYLRARYYDPATGRFLSEDPLRFSSGDLNVFRYVKNSPLSFTDPTGLIPDPSLQPEQTATLIDSYFEADAETGIVVVDTLLFLFGLIGGTEFFVYEVRSTNARSIATETTTKTNTETGETSVTVEVVDYGQLLVPIAPDSFTTSTTVNQTERDGVITVVETITATTVVNSLTTQTVTREVAAAVEWVFAAGLGLLAGGRWLQQRRQRRRKQQSAGLAPATAPRTALDDVDEVFAELAEED